jgi:hypothetical protein
MKLIACIFVLTFVAITAFAQGNEKRKPRIQDLKDYRSQSGDLLAIIDLDAKGNLKLDSAIVFTPEDFFLNREMYSRPIPLQNFKLPFYALPDPQSRMPIKRFDDSVNYTILRKEFN